MGLPARENCARPGCDANTSQLSVTVELAPGATDEPGRASSAAESIRGQLVQSNSEFAGYVPAGRQLPRVTLLPAGDANYFPPGVKHRYTRN